MQWQTKLTMIYFIAIIRISYKMKTFSIFDSFPMPCASLLPYRKKPKPLFLWLISRRTILKIYRSKFTAYVSLWPDCHILKFNRQQHIFFEYHLGHHFKQLGCSWNYYTSSILFTWRHSKQVFLMCWICGTKIYLTMVHMFAS